MSSIYEFENENGNLGYDTVDAIITFATILIPIIGGVICCMN